MILQFTKGHNKKETVILDNVSFLEYFSELQRAPIVEAKPKENLKEYINISRDLIPKGTAKHIYLGLEITSVRRKNKEVFFRTLTYIDRVTKEKVFIAHDEYTCYVCNDMGKTINRI